MVSSAGVAVIPSHVDASRVIDMDVYHPAGAEKDFESAWSGLLDPALPDLLWSPRNGGHWIARGEAIVEILSDPDRFSSRVMSAPRDLTEATQLVPLQLDPPNHATYREPVTRAFAAKYIFALEPRIRQEANALIDSCLARGECEFASQYAEILPVDIFLILVDLPTEDRPMLRTLAEQLNRPDGSMTGEQLMEHVTAYLSPHVTKRLTNPGDDLLSRIISQPIKGRAWTYEEAMRLCSNILLGGLDTVVAMLTFVTHHLAKNPDLQQYLRENRLRIPDAADEFIRRFASVFLGREVRFDLDYRGAQLKAGDIILIPTYLHNLDERSFPNAKQINIDRGLVRHSTMGHGAHRCVGAGLARQEVIIFLEEWLSRVPPFRIKDGEEVVMHGGSVAAIRHLPLTW